MSTSSILVSTVALVLHRNCVLGTQYSVLSRRLKIILKVSMRILQYYNQSSKIENTVVLVSCFLVNFQYTNIAAISNPPSSSSSYS